MLRIAIYDMDKTITRRATWLPFAIDAALRTRPWRLALLPIAGIVTLGYCVGLVSRGALKETTHRLLLGPILSPDAARTVGEDFADRVIAFGMFADALARIAADRAAGYRLVLATASYHFYVAPIAARLGFDAVIATESHHAEDGAILPGIAGENCYGPAKLRRIEAWLAAQGMMRATVHVRFYSDHASDTPTLAWADEPFAVNPHAALRTIAAARGWPIIDWQG